MVAPRPRQVAVPSRGEDDGRRRREMPVRGDRGFPPRRELSAWLRVSGRGRGGGSVGARAGCAPRPGPVRAEAAPGGGDGSWPFGSHLALRPSLSVEPSVLGSAPVASRTGVACVCPLFPAALYLTQSF